MKKFLLQLLSCLILLAPAHAQKKAKISKNKQAVIAAIDAQYTDLTTLSDKIWSYEEIAFQEKQSAEALIAYAEQQGFSVKRNII